jgi:DNA-binding transcriptional regulator LsrR (DeoR family)
MENVNYGYNEAHPTVTINKGGRPNINKTNEQKALAYNLYFKNINQKEIGKQLGISEKTISKWAKDWKESKTVKTDTIDNLEKRLLTMTNDSTTPIADIKSLVYVIQQLKTN